MALQSISQLLCLSTRHRAAWPTLAHPLAAAAWWSTSTSQPHSTQVKACSSTSGPPDGPSAAASVSASSPSAPTRLLLRDFIHQSLYHPTKGYFNRPFPVVGTLDQPIEYNRLATSREWNYVMSQHYKEQKTVWFTPVELFSPWYGYILARHIVEHRTHNLGQAGDSLEILEIGGGNGTLARDILNWLREHSPADYARTTYTCLEISSALAAKQYELVVSKAGHVGRFKVVQGNAWDRSTWGSTPDFKHTVILMMEVLDNLPHDKVYRAHADAPWMEAAVQAVPPDPSPPSAPASSSSSSHTPSIEDGPWQEVLLPLSDPLLIRALPHVYQPPTYEDRLDAPLNKMIDFLLAQAYDPVLPAGEEVFFVPTASLALLDLIHTMRPNHSLIAADFDLLPGVRIPGKNAPLVSAKVDGKNIDYDTILVPWGTADIFFPTNFDALAKLYCASAEHVWGQDNPGKVAHAHYKQGAFLKRYKEMEKTATLLSFNPMVNDFKNARFFLGDSYGRHPSHTAQPITPFTYPGMPPASAVKLTEAGAPGPGSGSAPVYDNLMGGSAGSVDSGAPSVSRGPTKARTAQQAPVIDFSWQYGYGGGMQHAAIKRGKRNPLAGKSSADGVKAGAGKGGVQQGQVAGGKGAGQAGRPQPGGSVGQQADKGKPVVEEPVLGGRHLRQKRKQVQEETASSQTRESERGD